MAPKPANKSAAVRQQKVGKVQDGDDAQTAIYRALEYFATPPWGARAGAEIIRKIDPGAQSVWEPACGEGHIAETMNEYFPTVYASDIHAHGYGEVQDFLLSEWVPDGPVDWLVTNPPFSLAPAFIERGLKVARRGVAMLLRVAFMEGTERYPLLWDSRYPLSHVAVFSERLPMVLGCYDPDASSAVCMAWFFFQKRHAHIPPAAIVTAIPPGTKARLHRPEDVRRFAKLAPAPLFDLVNQ